MTLPDSVPAWPRPPRPAPDAPNVVVILLDDVGFADVGSYGGAIRTPAFDRLAANGLRYRDFHTTALCSPSRAALLTGRNHHSNASGWLPSSPLGFPGYNAVVPRENGFLSEILRAQGYATFAIGKWHLTPYTDIADGSRRAHWPLQRGFDRFYGFLEAFTNQWMPNLVYDNHHVAPPLRPEEGYHLNADLADRAIQFISDLRAVDPNGPFVLYYCPGACHFPHHVPREWAARYSGAFDRGWDRLRDEVFARQAEQGIVPEGTTLPPRPDWIDAWDDLSVEDQRRYARQMEVYAGFLEHTDHHIGRLVSFLEAIGELDNTLLVVTSDNGADGADRHGASIRGREAAAGTGLEDWGGLSTYPTYSSAWAWVGNTPLRRWKRYVHEGGVRDPLIVHWPRGIRAKSEIRAQYTHITDVTPTILSALDIDPPAALDGVIQSPIEGVSFAHTFDDPKAPTHKRVQYYEMIGSRAIWTDGWKAVTEQRDGVLLTEDELAQQKWELYRVAEDFSESDDLAKQHPAKLRQLVELWWVEAGQHGVLPLHSRHQSLAETAAGPRADRPRRTRHVYYPGIMPLHAAVAVNLAGCSHRITAVVEIHDEGAAGVLIAHGGPFFGGYSLYLRDRRLHYVQSYLGREEHHVSSDTSVPTGTHALEVELTPVDDRSSDVRLRVDGQHVGRGTIAQTMHDGYGRLDEGLCIGYDDGGPVTRKYPAPFRFTGKIERVVVELIDPDGSD